MISYSRSAISPLQGLRHTFLQQFPHQIWQHSPDIYKHLTPALRSKPNRSLIFATVATFAVLDAMKQSLAALAATEVSTAVLLLLFDTQNNTASQSNHDLSF